MCVVPSKVVKIRQLGQPDSAVPEVECSELSGTDVDRLRFRTNLLVDGSARDHGFPEDDWVGHRLEVGEDVVLRVVRPLTRCVMIDMAQGRPSSRATC